MEEFKRGWGPLFAATVGTMCGLLTITNYTQAFFVGPVTEDLGWTPGQFFLSFTIMMCVGMVTAPAIGALAAKIGVRTIGMVGLVGHALSYILISLNPGSLPLWYASFAVLAVLGAGSLPIIWTAVLNGWFVANRGKAIGITMAGTGIGAFLLPPIVEYFIQGYGWRTAYQVVGVGALIVSMPIVFFLFKENPEASASAGGAKPSNVWGLTLSQAAGTAKFWVLGAVLFITVFVIVGVLSNFERILGSKGLDRTTIAGIAAVMGATVIVGRVAVGALLDRFWAPAVATVFFTLLAIALLLMRQDVLTVQVALVIAVFVGLSAGAELDLLAYLTGKYFGPRHYPTIFGCIFAFFTVGSGVAPPSWGQMSQSFGGYDQVLLGGVALLGVSIALFLLLGRYPSEERAASDANAEAAATEPS